MSAQAERLKVQFGSALAKEVRDNEIVVVPNLQGRDPKEISTRNLASIIQSRVEEMVEHVRYAIRLSGFERQLIGVLYSPAVVPRCGIFAHCSNT